MVLIPSILGCHGSKDDRRLTVDIVIPNATTGVFCIQEKPQAGMIVKSSGNLVKLVVPDSGILIVSDASFLREWHTTIVHYADGLPIPFVYDEDQPVAGIGCWALLSSSDSHYYYVGKSKGREVVFDLPISKLSSYFIRKTEENKNRPE